jgi:hypothetical protein
MERQISTSEQPLKIAPPFFIAVYFQPFQGSNSDRIKLALRLPVDGRLADEFSLK